MGNENNSKDRNISSHMKCIELMAKQKLIRPKIVRILKSPKIILKLLPHLWDSNLDVFFYCKFTLKGYNDQEEKFGWLDSIGLR